MNLKMSARQEDLNISAWANVVMVELDHLKDHIMKQAPFKKSKDWDAFRDDVIAMQERMDAYVTEMESKLKATYGENHVIASQKVATDHLNNIITEEQFFKEKITYRGKIFTISFLLEEKDSVVKLCGISPEPTEKGVKFLTDSLMTKLEPIIGKIESVKLLTLHALSKSELHHMEGERVVDNKNVEYFVDEAFNENKEVKLFVTRRVKISSEDFSANFKHDGKHIGTWGNLKFH